MSRRPGRGSSLHLSSCFEGFLELRDRAEVAEERTKGREVDQHLRSRERRRETGEHWDLLSVRVGNDTHFVPKQRIRLADGRGGEEVISRDGDVLELEVFHSDEEERKMGAAFEDERGQVRRGKERRGWRRESLPLEKTRRSRVSDDGLIVFLLESERMSESDPRWSETRVHEGCFSVTRKGRKSWSARKRGKSKKRKQIATNPKYLLASPHRSPVKYQSPTAYQLVASSGSASASS